jgi:hypothetical protein
VEIRAPGSALAYILLHETTHIVDRTLKLTSSLDPRFTAGIWLDRTALAEPWSKSPIASTTFRHLSALPGSAADRLYQSLTESPFTSLYATAAAPEDFAELVSWRELALRSRDPLDIIVRNQAGAVIGRFRPLSNPRVAQRFHAVDTLLMVARDRGRAS